MTNKTTSPTKKEILNKHVSLYFSSHHDGENGGAEWHTDQAIAEDIYKAMDEWAAINLHETITDLYACLDPSNRLGYDPQKVKEWFEKHPKTE